MANWPVHLARRAILHTMDLQHPFQMLTPNLEGDILSLLAKGERSYSGREVEREVGASHDAVRMALRRLVAQGIVSSEPGGGRAILYQLNRDHLAAPWIEGIAALRLELIARLRSEILNWKIKPVAAALFGSAARNEATAKSDLDLLLIRPAARDAEDEGWQEQLANLSQAATRWTGNDARILEYGEDELVDLVGEEPVLQDAADQGIDLHGSFRRVWQKTASR